MIYTSSEIGGAGRLCCGVLDGNGTVVVRSVDPTSAERLATRMTQAHAAGLSEGAELRDRLAEAIRAFFGVPTAKPGASYVELCDIEKAAMMQMRQALAAYDAATQKT